ncbi:hypothetical protein SVAN01_07917 [Stagonosporopsis vannaccii]|nr:hypothetical protein SVAN01_07917 [Stagonosporopsis vannaccii]
MNAANNRQTATPTVLPATNTPKVSFEHLPREIRDAVYLQTWLQTPYISFSSSSWGIFSYGYHVSGSQRGLPLWLLTNKTIFREGLQQWFRELTWMFRGRLSPELVQAFPSVVTSFATKFYFGAKKEVGSREQPAIHYGDIIAPAHAPALLKRFGPQLAHLWIDFDQHLPAYSKREWRLDLSCLDSVELRLESLTVSCCNATRWGKHDRDTFAPGLVEAYETETRRVGARLVRADAAVEVTFNLDVIDNRPYGGNAETIVSFRVICGRQSA